MQGKIGILGGGSWGTAMAVHLAQKHKFIVVWEFEQERALLVEKERFNGTYLPGIRLAENISFTPDINALSECEILVLAIPTQFIRRFFEQFKEIFDNDVPIVSLCKGIEQKTLFRVSEIVAEFFPTKPYLALSGPTHAEEVVRKMPSAIVASSKHTQLMQDCIEIFRTAYFRVYPNDDLIGAEIGGALKNVIAIACGISDGLKFGDNTRAALMTRGLEEMRRIGVKMGAKSETFMGLTGMGDLIVTCSSQHSRNRRVGLAMGQGYSLQEVLSGMQMVAEGVHTTKSAKSLIDSLQLEAPIIDTIYDILYNGYPCPDAIARLMERQTKPEQWDES